MADARDLLRKTCVLQEDMSFRQLLAMSEPRRVLRSKTVRGPNLDIEAFERSMFFWFNFKAFPSSEGKRHKGYIKFVKPRNPSIPLEQVMCVVDCDCRDYRYRWAWANKQRGASRVGSGSLNMSLNRAPRITNPTGRPGLCKHLIALRDYIYGQDASFIPSEDPEDSTRLAKLTAGHRNVTIDGEGRPITDRERLLNQRAALRRHGQDPDAVIQPAPEPEPPEPGDLPPNRNPRNESLAVRRVVSNMESADRVKSIREMVEQTAAEQGSQELPKDEQALQALKGMQGLLGELVALQKAETGALEPEGLPAEEPAADGPPAVDPALELPEPPAVPGDDDEAARRA